MHSSEEKYVIAFVFDATFSQVLLLHKIRPEWLAGKISGVGGRYEPDETGLHCVRREVKEEACLDIPEPSWVRVGTIRNTRGNVGVYAATYGGALTDAVQGDDEEIEWFPVSQLPDTVSPDLRWLVPLTLDRLTNETPFRQFVVEY